MADEPEASRTARENAQNQRYSRYIVRAPSVGRALAYLGVVVVADSLLVWFPGAELPTGVFGGLVVFLVPSLLAVALTPPLAAIRGGQFTARRSALLALTCAGFPLPFLLLWRALGLLLGTVPVSAAALLLLVQGFVLWFRHMSLFGMSNPRHGPTLPASLVQPLLSMAGIFLYFRPSLVFLAGAGAFLILGFLTAAFLLRSADRPLRREFDASGVSFIRPLLEHVSTRDPAATETLERFFSGFSVSANIRITALQFHSATGIKATVALPAVHPGPFAALGASDLPRKLGEILGPRTGTLLVPHTPCNHDLDVPSSTEVRRLGEAIGVLGESLRAPTRRGTSPLVEPYPGSWARAQVLGDAVLVVASQAPAPTDDIAFSVVDRFFETPPAGPGSTLALIDAHNSYREDAGDLTYGSSGARRLAEDIRKAIASANARVSETPIRVGVARRTGYRVGLDGIGPHGLSALVVETAGSRTAYVLIDGNNLVEGLRAPLLDDLRGLVDAAEILTTDNHVVHEVDGGVNPVGERYPLERLRADVVDVVRAALTNLENVEVRAGSGEVRDVAVLGPDWTARLLTALGDTLSMFSNAFFMTFLLLVASSAIVLAVLR